FSSSGASSHLLRMRPNATLSYTDELKRNGSCWTRPICPLHHRRLSSFRLTPSRSTAPTPPLSPSASIGSYHLSKRATMVLFALPLGPTIAVCLPASNSKSTPFKIWTPSRFPGYEQRTFSKRISGFQPSAKHLPVLSYVSMSGSRSIPSNNFDAAAPAPDIACKGTAMIPKARIPRKTAIYPVKRSPTSASLPLSYIRVPYQKHKLLPAHIMKNPAVN